MGEERFQVLSGVDFEIQTGEIVAIMGPSGSGKSTLMNLVGCLMTPERGEVELFGQAIHNMNRNQLADMRRDHIGFIFQQFNLLSRTSALDNVKMPLMYCDQPVDDADERAKRCLEMVGLVDRLHHHPSQLSGGQQQRVAIARALINEPDILLADEPTGALDSKTGDEIMALFKSLNEQGKTVILVTHDSEVAEKTSRTLFVRDGQLQSTFRFQSQPSVEQQNKDLSQNIALEGV
jgi:putative ABC transport system ATP-binding protein